MHPWYATTCKKNHSLTNNTWLLTITGCGVTVVRLGVAVFTGKFKGSIIGDDTMAGWESGGFLPCFFGLLVWGGAGFDLSSFWVLAIRPPRHMIKDCHYKMVIFCKFLIRLDCKYNISTHNTCLNAKFRSLLRYKTVSKIFYEVYKCVISGDLLRTPTKMGSSSSSSIKLTWGTCFCHGSSSSSTHSMNNSDIVYLQSW